MTAPHERRTLEAELDSVIAAFVDECECDVGYDELFNELALAVFRHQFRFCEPYRIYCLRRGVCETTPTDWRQIPAVPVDAFKYAFLTTCDLAEVTYEFRTSGTTGTPGRVFRDDAALRLCRHAWIRAHKEFLTPDVDAITIFSLAPTSTQAPHASIAHCVEALVEHFGAANSRNFVSNGVLDVDALLDAVAAAEARGDPIELYGPTLGVAALLDCCDLRGIRFRLPPGSRLGHGSGYKGQRREMTNEEFDERVEQILGIPRMSNVNVLGMTELGSQYYEDRIRSSFKGLEPLNIKARIPWVRTRVLDPFSGVDMPQGTPGVLVHYDLTLRGTVLAVQTEDVGVSCNGGFRISGRVAAAEPRGCHLA